MVEPVHPVPGEKSEVLELTEVVDEDGSVRRVAPEAGSPEKRAAEPAAAVDPTAGNATARSGPGPLRPEAEVEPRLELGRERILSSATSGAAAAAFAQLGSLPRERRREGELPLGGVDRTLEDIVRDMLRPLLQTWLDEHLPGWSSGWSEKRSHASLGRPGCADPPPSPVASSGFCRGYDELLRCG